MMRKEKKAICLNDSEIRQATARALRQQG